ncbi:related to 6-hydroxy-D-nicotine oxidase [Sporisorium reilianum f. sp. reilianum]|uniref:Related to 6-hydroxy-D-nicotine oxidase n=1 Tax=Sporisorium reilianum f. sp. reilianum TaxID=72559 RepID=A0A2N8UIZ7_9BASI|nr:related to 6-hydroxy-D-nicotine oxidase [Sporisorium reilianum f. sp. reilianum]
MRLAALYRLVLGASTLFSVARASHAPNDNTTILQPRVVAATRLQRCLGEAGIEVVAADVSTAEVYFQASASDNVVFHYNPTLIAYPSSASLVQQAVVCVSEHSDAPIAARSGGHSFAGFGSGGMDGSVVIDLARLNSVVSHPQSGTVEVGPGARLGDVVKGLWHQGNGQRAMSTGTCAAVGVGGLSLCGGFGPMSRKWGLTTDSILEADLVLANGSMVTVSESQHPELLWALRGSGSFFGIVTRFLFRSQDASPPVISFEYRWTPSIDSLDKTIAVIMAVQAFSLQPSLSNDLGLHIQLHRPSHGDPQPSANRPISIEVKGIYLGPVAEWDKLQSALKGELRSRSAPRADVEKVSLRTYLELMEEWDDFGKGEHKLDTEAIHKQHNNFVIKSSLTLEPNKGFDEQALRPLFQYLWDTSLSAGQDVNLPNGKHVFWGWNIYFELFGGGTPAHAQPKAKKLSSFPHRDGLWLIQVAVGTVSYMDLAHSGHVYARELDARVNGAIEASGLGRGGYSCYVDSDLNEDEWKQLYYGDSIPRLEEIKMQLDPQNLFRNPQTLGSRRDIQARRKAARRRRRRGQPMDTDSLLIA